MFFRKRESSKAIGASAEYVDNICLFNHSHEVRIQASALVFGENTSIQIRRKMPRELFNQVRDWADSEIQQLGEKS